MNTGIILKEESSNFPKMTQRSAYPSSRSRWNIFKIRVNLSNFLAFFEIILVPQVLRAVLYSHVCKNFKTVERVPNYDVSYHEICYWISQDSGKIYPI